MGSTCGQPDPLRMTMVGADNLSSRSLRVTDVAVPVGPVNSLRLQILGPLRLWRDDVELDAGPRQQAYLLALLLAREGRPTSAGELIDLIWGAQAPVSALNVIHKYVGALRGLLEPNLPARGAGSHLPRWGDGYLFAAGTARLDLVAFRELVDAAGADLAEHRGEAALDSYVEALGLWHGAASDGLAHGPSAMPIFAGLNDQVLRGVCGSG
jgi:Transcriptional regulatory protein, C terminal/Bacterial transcriptional activator domain